MEKRRNTSIAYIRPSSSIFRYATRAEAENTLVNLRSKTVDEIEQNEITMQELFNSMLMTAEKENLSVGTISSYKNSVRKCAHLLERPYSSISWQEMNDAVLAAPTRHTRFGIKNLFKKLDREAERHNLPGKRYADYIVKISNTENDVSIPRIPLADEEIQALLSHPDSHDIHIPHVILYTGLRPIEFRSIKKCNVDLKLMTIREGRKTAAGINRLIPIHPYIERYIQEHMDTPGDYLFPNESGNIMNTQEFSLRFKMAIQPYVNPGHIPYELRHSFCTRLDEQNVRYNVINALMGHKQYNAGAQNYIHINLDRL